MPKSKTFKPRIILPEMKPLQYDLEREKQTRLALAILKRWKRKMLFTLR